MGKQSIYQTAKVSKLLMIEKVSALIKYKGQSLAEIDIDPNSLKKIIVKALNYLLLKIQIILYLRMS